MAARSATASARTAAWAIASAAVILAAHIPAFFHRLDDIDEADHASIAALMNSGGALYGAGGVDNKPPGVFWVYALVFRVFGTYQMTAVHAAGLLAMALTCVILFLIARGMAGLRAGLIAAVLYGVLTAAGNPRLLASNTEIFMMLPLAASVLLMIRRKWFWSGGALIAAAVFRQSALSNLLLVAIAIPWLEPAGHRLRALWLFCVGLAAGSAVTITLIASTGSLSGFWRWTVATLAGYASSNLAPSIFLPHVMTSVVPFVVASAIAWIAAGAFALRWRTLSSEDRVMIVWLAVGLAGSFAGLHLSWHYFVQAMGPLAVVTALALDRLQLRRAATAAAVIGIAVPAVAWWAFDVTADPLTYDWSGPTAQHESVAAFVRDHTSARDRVFVWGDWPALYVESDRLMSSRFPGFLRGFARGSGLPPNNWDTAPDVWPTLQADLAANPPALIVDTAAAGWNSFWPYPMSGYPVLSDLVRSHYHAVATIDGVVIYARN